MTDTESKSLLGYSPNYSPLEQIQGSGTDRRSDIYSLGATLYHLLTGVKPTDALSRATAVINGQPDPLRPADELNREIAVSVSTTLMRAMALNIEHRPRNASEMRDDLQQDTSWRAPSTVPMIDAVDETTRVSLPVERARMLAPAGVHNRERGRQVVVPVPEETFVARKQSVSGRKWIMAAFLTAALIGISAALYLLFSGSDTNRRTQTNRPVVRTSPTPAPTPPENTNQRANTNSPPAPSADQMAARAKLEKKNIPYSEEAFTRIVEEGDTGAVDLFLAAGMNPDVRDAARRTALINAASKGSNNISQKLLRKGADVNARDGVNSTALMESARNDHKETTKVLLENGADVNLTDNNGQTALIRAAAQGHAEIVRMLINKRARVDIKDKDGRDALTWAEINNKSDVVDLLKKAGATRP
jgi:hypothetical protein